MLKKTLATALLVCSVPALANAWFFTTQVKSAGGTIDSKNRIGQTVANGAVFKSYTASEANPNYPANAVITPQAGYKIKSIVVNGGTAFAPANPAAAFTQTFSGSADRSITALFQADSYVVTAKVIDGGASVTPTKVSNIYQGSALAADLKFTFTPKAGYNITSITGVTAGGKVSITPAVSPASPAPVNTPVVVKFEKGYIFNSGFTLGATTANATARINPIAPVTFSGYAPATLTATGNALGSSPVFTWTYVSGPQDTVGEDPSNPAKQITVPLPAVTGFSKNPLTGAYQFTGASFSYSPSVKGTYKFVVSTPNPVVTNPLKPALSAAAVILNPDVSAVGICSSCHIANQVGGTGSAQAIATAYAASIHSQSTHSACEACHYGTGNGSHPGTVSKLSVDPATFQVKANDGVTGPYGPVAQGQSFCSACHSGQYDIPHPTTGLAKTCATCHAGGADAHSITAIDRTGTNECAPCHTAANGKFTASKHWNNTLEYSYQNSATDFGIFYNGAPALATPSLDDPNAIPSINANRSYNVFEWNKPGAAPTAPVTCSTKCHFETEKSTFVAAPATGPLMPVSGVKACNTCHSGGLLKGGTFKNGSSAAHKVQMYSSNTCEYCHYSAAGTGHGLSTAEFKSSKHWNNTFEYNDAVNTFTGGAVDGQINPNESWTTKENGAQTTCAYNCHFKPNLGPTGMLKPDGTPAKDGRAVLRPGLDSCLACHDPHKPTSSAVATCYECHTGSKHGGTTNGYKASVHFASAEFHPTEESRYNSSNYVIVKADCLACHNPHKPEQTTPTSYSMNAKINVCAACHNGIGAQARLIGQVVHFASASTAATVAPSGLSYVGSAGRPVNSCTECHFDYNAHTVADFKTNEASKVLASWSESGHGSLNAETWKADDHRYKANNDRAGTTKGVTPANSKDNFCVHCHTTQGLIQFVNTADSKHAVFSNISSVGDRSNWDASPLICSGCHAPDAKGFTSKAVRAVPAAVGFYNISSSATNNLSSKILTSHQFADYGQSNVCMTCHVGAAGSGEVIKKAFAQNSNFAGSYVNPHHGYPGATLGQYGLYEYGNYAGLVNSHAAIGGNAQGPCVSCHMNGTDHSMKAVDINGLADDARCASCHRNGFSVSTAKANYLAALDILKNLLVANGLPTARAAAAWGTGTTGANNMGASMNYFTLSSAASDAAAYVHNPNYAKKVLFDTIDWLAHGSITGDITDVYTNPTYTGALTAEQIAAAKVAMTTIDSIGKVGECTVCHSSSTDPISNQNIIAEYSTTGHGTSSHGPTCVSCHTSAGAAHPEAGISGNYLKVGANCISCHNGNYSRQIDGVTHWTNTPNAAFDNISAAYVGYKGKGINVCSNCHFNFEGHGIGATTVATFTQNSDILAIWAESGHGKRTGLAWLPSAGHDWRNTGSTVDFKTNIPASDCVRCHTADGFVNFANSGFSNVQNVGAADGNRYNSPLSCNACHKADANGSAVAARLPVAAVSTFYNVSTVDKVTKKSVKSRIQATFPNVGESNICIGCHAARVIGPNLTEMANSGNWDLSNASFQNSHYMAAAGTMYMTAGFKNFTTLTAPAPSNNEGAAFASSKTYNQTLTALNTTMPGGVTGGQNSAHRRVGTALIAGSEDYLVAANDPTAIASNGPCVTCHMKAYNAVAGNGFTPPAAGRPAAGHSLEIDEATAQQLCLQCHADAPHLDGGDGNGNAVYTTMTNLADMENAMMEPQKEAYQNGINVLKQILLVKYQIKYDPASYPYFYDMQKDPAGKTAVTDWTRKNVAGLTDAAVQAFGSAKLTVIPAGGLTQLQAYRLMGACYNLNLMARDPGGYLHARTYVQRLVYDSLDYLDNNVIDYSALTSSRALNPVVYHGTNVNVHANDGTLATESMAWMAGTHYSDSSSGNTMVPLKLRP